MKCVLSFSFPFCWFAFLCKYFPRRQFDKILGLCRSHSWNANSTLKTFLLQSSAIETDWSKKAFWRKFLLKCCNNLSKESLQQNLYWKRVAPSARGERSKYKPLSQVCHWNRFRVFDGSPRPVPGAQGREGQWVHEGQGQSCPAGDDNDHDGDDVDVDVDDYKVNHVHHWSLVFINMEYIWQHCCLSICEYWLSLTNTEYSIRTNDPNNYFGTETETLFKIYLTYICT